MADSDGPPAETNDSAPAAPPSVTPVAPVPRVNPPNIHSPKEAPPAGGPPGFNDFLEWMRGQAVGETAPGSAGQRGLIPRERKKFQRRDAEAKTEPPAAASSPKESPAADSPPRTAADAPVRAAVSPTAEPATASSARSIPAVTDPPAARVRRQQAATKRNSWLGMLAQLGVLVLLAGSFVLGRFTVSKEALPPPAAPAAPQVVNSEGKQTTNILSDANATLIDQAMAAEQGTDFKKATGLLEKVKASGQHVPGLAFELAQLEVFAGEYNKALPLLNQALVLGENQGDVYNMRATLNTRTGMIRGTGMNDYETATKIDPFNARNFFYWGEALRRAGKDQAAILRLQQAIDRLREPTLESLYRLKLRLAKIEAGQEKDFAEELAGQLALPNPEMDWLVTAAAQELHSGRFAAAATYLDRAALRGDAEMFSLRLRDYYLFQFKYEKELARFYPKPNPDKPGTAEKQPAPGDSPSPDLAAPPAIGLDLPVMPTPAAPGASLPR